MSPSPIHVLAVDDEPDLCALSKDFLEMSEAMEVETACSVSEARAALGQRHFDVIVSDYQMPEEDGIQFLKSLRAAGDRMPFILFTGKGREEVVIEALNQGADSYLQKGGDPKAQFAELANMIEKAVQRRRMELDLIENEEKFKNIFNSANDAILIINPDGRILEINDIGCNRLGYAKQEMLQKNVKDIDSEQYSGQVRDRMKEVMEGGFALFETEWVTKGGSLIPSEISARKINYAGRPAILSVARDVSERKKNEETLIENEVKFRTVADFTYDWEYWIAPDGHIIHCSPSCERITGYSSDELSHDPSLILEMVHPEDKPLLDKHLEMEMGAEPFEFDFRIITRKGEMHWISHACQAVFDDKGGWQGRRVGNRDITERKRAEEAMRESEKRYRLLVDSADEFIVVIQDGMVKLVNPIAVAMTGFSEQEIMSKPFPSFIHPDDRAMVVERHQTRLKGEAVPARYAFRLLAKDGSTKWVEIGAVTIEWEGRPATLNFLTDITERKRAEEELRWTSDRLSLATRAGGVGIWELDVINNKLTWDDQMFRLYGVQREHFGGAYETWKACVLPEDLQQSDAEVQMALRGEKEFDTEFRILWPDGSIRHIHALALVQRDASGQPLCLVGTNQDISERKRAEEVLRESEDRFEQLAEQGGIVTWEVDADGLYTYVSRVSETVWGYRPDELMGKKYFYDLTPEAERESLKAMAFEVFKNRERFVGLQNPIQTRDSRIVWVSTNGIPLLNADGTLRGYQGTDTDITERKRAEDALRMSERKYRLLAENITDVIWTLNIATQRFTYASPSVEKLSGFTVEETMQQTLKDLLHPDSYAEIMGQLPTWIEQFLHGSKAGIARRLVARERRKDGTWMDVEVVATLLLDDKGKFTEILGVTRDVTDRVSAEQALHETNRKLNLLSSITRHDINNQLMVLAGNLTLLENGQSDHSSDEHLRKAEVAAERISTMIQFTKTYEDIGVHAPLWQDVGALIDTGMRDIMPGAIKVVNDVPAGTEVFADPLITKVFHNLIHNAVKHGGNVTTIHFSVEEVEGARAIICEDDGVGISADMKEKLFTHGFGKDHGLGLFLSREILSITGITITEAGALGRGARFVITIPTGGLREPKTDGS